MEAYLLSIGKNVGSFTSPHLFDHTERVKLNGKPVTENQLQAELLKFANQDLTYFEQLTLAALVIFKQSNLDVVLLEVGLGGRLDAVNIVNNDIAIITSIGLDHTQYLGNTIEEIAKEKAGIIKENKIIISGDPNIAHIIKPIALARNAKYYDQHNNSNWDLIAKDLPPPVFPASNAIAGLLAMYLLFNKLFIDNLIINIPGRFQIINKNGVEWIFDCAHNPPATLWLAEKIAARFCAGKTYVIFEMKEDKDYKNSIQPLLAVIDQWYDPNSTVLQPGDRVIVSGGFKIVAKFLKLKQQEGQHVI